MNHLGDQIKHLRTARKMTQAEFAERISVTKSAVSAYENDTRLPSYGQYILGKPANGLGNRAIYQPAAS